MNFEGMRRRGFSAEAIAALRRAYKVVYRQGLTVEQALAEESWPGPPPSSRKSRCSAIPVPGFDPRHHPLI